METMEEIPKEWRFDAQAAEDRAWKERVAKWTGRFSMLITGGAIVWATLAWFDWRLLPILFLTLWFHHAEKHR